MSIVYQPPIDTNKTNFDLKVALGEVEGIRRWGMIGKTVDIDTNDINTDVWAGDGEYVAMDATAAETMEIFSDNSQDSATGTGARAVLVQGLLDGDYNQMPDVVVALDGTNTVSLGAQTYLRGGTSFIVLSAGSEGHNVGNITIRHTTTTTNIFNVMLPEENQAEVCAFTVPVGKTLLINTIYVSMARGSGASGGASISGLVRPFGGVWNTTTHPEITDSHGYEFSSGGYYLLPEKTDVKVRVRSVTDNNTIVSADAYGLLKDN